MTADLNEVGRLADGSPPATTDQLLGRLRALQVDCTTIDHEPVFTVEQAKMVRSGSTGVHTKSLFLRNKKGCMWLVVCLEDRSVDLKQLADRLGAGRLSFGSPDRLMRYLGVIPGAVSPFAVINDKGNEVAVVFDRSVLEGAIVHLHPLDNAKTTAIAVSGLTRFLEVEGHAPTVIDFGT